MRRNYKIFVRQKEENFNEKITNDHKSELNFRGDEAKKVYEEIIQETQDDHKPSKNSTTNVQRLNSNKTTNIVKAKSHRTKQVPVETEVNANRILKAIDQVDWDFLECNVNKNNVNIVDNFGWTPLMSAAFSGKIKVVEFLLELGADKYLKEKTGLTALQLAQKKKHKEIISLLRNKRTENLNNGKKVAEESDFQKLEEFYCAICKNTFKETTVRKHEASLLHIFNTNPKLPDPAYGIPKQNRGYQMMLNTGWEESKGLGPSGSGQKFPVKTVLKRDRKGLGKGDAEKPRITHFQSNDLAAVKHVRQERIRIYGRKHIERNLRKEARRERAIRHALS